VPQYGASLDEAKWPGYIPEWAEFMAGARVWREISSDQLTCARYLDRCRSWDSDSAGWLTRAILEFSKGGGSGPFKLDKETKKGREEVAFIAIRTTPTGRQDRCRACANSFRRLQRSCRELRRPATPLAPICEPKDKELASLPNVTITPAMANRRSISWRQ